MWTQETEKGETAVWVPQGTHHPGEGSPESLPGGGDVLPDLSRWVGVQEAAVRGAGQGRGGLLGGMALRSGVTVALGRFTWPVSQGS